METIELKICGKTHNLCVGGGTMPGKTQELMADLRADWTPNERDHAQVLGQAYRIASELSVLRVANGWTQQHLSELSGVSQADISRIERVSLIPNLTTLARLADALGAEIELRALGSNRSTVPLKKSG
jgi:DNA-binding XRE family transcriptional regulator